MSDYTKITDFEAKDSLPSGDAGKIIKGADFEVEFDAISTAIATKSDLENPTFTGTVTIPTLTLDGTTVTSTGAELNILDGVTATAAEINVLDGITVTTEQLNTTASKIATVVEDTTPQLGGNLDVNGNSIVSASNGDIAITPDGSGQIVLDGLNWPTSDGVADYILKTDGAGNLSWVIQASVAAGEVALDTTPQLGGNLDVNGNSIVSVSNGNINITPDGTGKVVTTTASATTVEATTVEANNFRLGNVNTGASGTTLTAGEMFISTAASQTVTLPASPVAGDTVRIGVQDFTDTVVARNGENIMSTAENLTIDSANVTITLTYINSTIGWRIS